MSNQSRRVVILTLIGFVACGSINCRGYRTAVELDKVAKSIDEYGFASISAPFLAAPSEVFEFDLNKSADYYFERANSPQGAARVLNSRAVDTQGQIRVNIEQALQTYAQYSRAKTIADFREAQRKAKAQLALLDPLLDAATAWQSAAEKAAVNAATVGNPVANILGNQFVDGTQEARVAQLAAVKGMLSSIAEQEEPDAEALPGFVATTQPVADKPPFAVADRNAFNAVGGSFTPGLDMPSGPFAISAREAMLIASGDMATQSLLKWFMRPQGNKLRNYELYFCPIIVSVQPGYETRNNFQADVTVNVDLARPGKDECEFEYLSDKFGRSSIPVQVAGVFPVLDAQVLDLANSQRRLYAMAFQLATLGFGSQANFFSDFAKKLELDVETRSSLTSGTAYTIGSTAFGFRVEPKNVGIKGALRLTQSRANPLSH
ncbi:MAG: hypothetical protein KDA33_14810 [Phycisphaerales bacterium]|nr:hypothetical protein [Phycisphaerales bacterium]